MQDPVSRGSQTTTYISSSLWMTSLKLKSGDSCSEHFSSSSSLLLVYHVALPELVLCSPCPPNHPSSGKYIGHMETWRDSGVSHLSDATKLGIVVYVVETNWWRTRGLGDGQPLSITTHLSQRDQGFIRVRVPTFTVVRDDGGTTTSGI